MKSGDRLDRYEVGARVSTRDGVERWRGVATDTGDPVELLVLTVADARARAEFLDRHAALARVRDPALASTLLVRPGDRPVAVRAPLEDPTLGAVATPLDSATAAWIGARLFPAVLAAGPSTRGALRAADIGLDFHGHPVLAPLIEPTTRVALGATRSVAPEAFDGHPPDAAAGLYGLGVVLYELATGQPPATVGTRASRPPPPPPSALRHGIPPGFDAAVLRLLSSDPGLRIGALPMLQDLAGPPIDLRGKVRVSPASAPIVTTRTGGDPARALADRAASAAPDPRRAPEPGGLAIVPAAALVAMDPANRSLAAGLAGVPLQVVDLLAAQSLPLVLATAAGRSAAVERATALARSSGLPVVSAAPGAIPGWLVFAVASAIAAVPGLLAAILLLVGWLPGAIGSGIAALFVLLVGGVGAWRVDRGRALHASATTALVRSREGVAARDGQGLLSAAWDRVAKVRLDIARADLPGSAGADLRGALKDVEARLQTLAQVAETADRTLRQVDLPALRSRLGTLTQRAGDEARRAERDRLARTIADLEAVEASRRTIVPEANVISEALSEIAAVIAQLEVDEDAALARLDKVARAARAAALSTPAARALSEAPVGPLVRAPEVHTPELIAPDAASDGVRIAEPGGVEDAVEVLADDAVSDDAVSDDAMRAPAVDDADAPTERPSPRRSELEGG